MFKQACAVLAAFSLMVLMGCGGGDAPAPTKSGGGGAATTAPKTEKKSSSKKEAPPAGAKGSVKGVVSFDGEAPKRKQIDVAGDKFCAAKHESDPLLTEEVVVKDGKLANVIVYVKSGADKWEFPTPTEAVKIDQHGCHYIPHVLAMMAGQSLDIVNSDETTHNIHGMGKENPEFNIGQPPAKKDSKKLESAELPYNVGCDVHKWMNAKIGVFDNPFFAVTGEDGAFELKGLPDGEYEVEAWHEKLPAQSGKVTIKDGAAASQNFTFKK